MFATKQENNIFEKGNNKKAIHNKQTKERKKEAVLHVERHQTIFGGTLTCMLFLNERRTACGF